MQASLPSLLLRSYQLAYILRQGVVRYHLAYILRQGVVRYHLAYILTQGVDKVDLVAAVAVPGQRRSTKAYPHNGQCH